MALHATYTSYTGHSAQSITVTTQAELDAAISNLSASGGTILLDANGGPFTLAANNFDGAGKELLIQSLDPTNKALITDVDIINSSFVTIDSVNISSAGTNTTETHDVNVRWSDSVEITNSTFWGDANGTLDGSPGVIRDDGAVLFEDSSNITLSGNTLTHYGGGVGYMNIVGLNITGNELSHIQGDGVQGGGIQNVVISNNYMHDFYGSAQTLNHTDFIQIWGVNAKITTSNVEISGNILDANGGASGQGIFIRNEEFANTGYYQDIRIFDNIVHVADWAGIHVDDTQGAQVYDNTVLWDQNAWVLPDIGQPVSQGQPWIWVNNAPGSAVQDNVAWHIYDNGQTLDSSNYIIDYKDPSLASYYLNHFNGIDMLPSSPLYGVVGATIDTSFTSLTSGSISSPQYSGGTTTSSTQTNTETETSTAASTETSTDTETSTETNTDTETSTDDGAEADSPKTGSPKNTDDDENEFFLIKLLKAILAIFNFGRKTDDTDAEEESPAPTQNSAHSDEVVLLSDIVPLTEPEEEILQDEAEDDISFDLVA